MFCDKDAAYKAEIIWVLKFLQACISGSLCDRIDDVFEAMFLGKLPPQMLVSAEEAMYLITDAGHPHCKQSLTKDIGEACFALEHNETLIDTLTMNI